MCVCYVLIYAPTNTSVARAAIRLTRQSSVFPRSFATKPTSTVSEVATHAWDAFMYCKLSAQLQEIMALKLTCRQIRSETSTMHITLIPFAGWIENFLTVEGLLHLGTIPY